MRWTGLKTARHTAVALYCQDGARSSSAHVRRSWCARHPGMTIASSRAPRNGRLIRCPAGTTWGRHLFAGNLVNRGLDSWPKPSRIRTRQLAAWCGAGGKSEGLCPVGAGMAIPRSRNGCSRECPNHDRMKRHGSVPSRSRPRLVWNSRNLGHVSGTLELPTEDIEEKARLLTTWKGDNHACQSSVFGCHCAGCGFHGSAKRGPAAASSSARATRTAKWRWPRGPLSSGKSGMAAADDFVLTTTTNLTRCDAHRIVAHDHIAVGRYRCLSEIHRVFPGRTRALSTNNVPTRVQFAF